MQKILFINNVTIEQIFGFVKKSDIHILIQHQ